MKDRRLSIIDVTSEDDSLLDGNPLNQQHQHSENLENANFLYTPNSKKFEDAATKLEQWDHEPPSNDTSQIGKPNKNSKCNLRKSLAWDSAFFTSAGVLDPEELSSIIEGVEKDEKVALPDIQEDVYKSCESISTLGSDSLTLDSVEVEGDLFEDVRASIQKSSNKGKLASVNTKVPSSPRVPGFQSHDSSKKTGMVSHNKMKAPSTSKNSSTGIQGFGKTTKSNPIIPQLPQPAATRRESSISRQSKVLGKPIPSSTISTKRVSLDLHVKNERDKAKRIIGDRVSSVSKASVIGGSRSAVPKPTLPSKSPSGPSLSTQKKSGTSTSSAVRTPSRIVSRNKTEPGNSSLSGLLSSTKLSSSISPASSISDWSSESSSSTSMAKRICNSSRSSIDSSASRKVLSDTEADQDTNSQIPQSDSSLERQETQHTGFISQNARTVPGATILPPAPKKPSGLRLPSPKIGFFDGVKPLVRTPRGGLQPCSVGPGGLPKQGVESPREGQNKAKLGKLLPSKSITSTENVKPNKAENTSPSHVVEKAHHDFLPLKGVTNQENAHHDNQIDCLSKQVGRMDMNLERQEKLNGDSLSFLQTDISFHDKSNDLELSSHKELNDCPKKEELMKGSSTNCLPVSQTCFDKDASARRPFAVKDSFCNIDGIVFTESAVSELKTTTLSVPESIIVKENN